MLKNYISLVKKALFSNNSQLVKQALSSNTYYDTPSVLSPDDIILRDRLDYYTLNEDRLVQEIIEQRQKMIEQYKNDKRKRSLLLHTGAIALAILTGGMTTPGIEIIDGLSLAEFGILQEAFPQILKQAIPSGFVTGTAANNVLEMMDEHQLEELNLQWLNSRRSYAYHLKTHSGHALKRLLTIPLNSSKDNLKTRFAVQFPDQYIAYLSPINVSPIKDKLDEIGSFYNSNSFVLSGEGENCNWIKKKNNLGYYIDDNGVEYPVELWSSEGRERTVAVIEYQKPDHSVY